MLVLAMGQEKEKYTLNWICFSQASSMVAKDNDKR
jgi:hypothetical protein